MKILSQTSSAVQNESGKPTSAATSKENFQSTLTESIQTAAAGSMNGNDLSVVRSRTGEPKKFSTSPDGKKKGSYSDASEPKANLQGGSYGAQSLSVATPVQPSVVHLVPESGNADKAQEKSAGIVTSSRGVSSDVPVSGSGVARASQVSAQFASLASQAGNSVVSSAADGDTAEHSAVPEATARITELADLKQVTEKTPSEMSDAGTGKTTNVSEVSPQTLPEFKSQPNAAPVSKPLVEFSAKPAVQAPAPQNPGATSQTAAGVMLQPQSAPATESSARSMSSAPDAASVPVAAAPAADPQVLTPISPQTTAQEPAAQGAATGYTVVSNSTLTVPAAKSDTPVLKGANVSVVSAKGKQPGNRMNSFTASVEEKDTSDAVGNDLSKMRIVAAETMTKDVSGRNEETAQGAALTQTVQVAQSANPIAATSAAAATPKTSGNSDVAPSPMPVASAESAQVAHAMSGAQLIQSAHSSEMKLGMQSAEFGNISISTSLNHQALSAQISIDHSALGHALSAHLPAIEEKLGSAYGVQAKVELRDTGARSSANGAGSDSGQNSQSRSGTPARSTGHASGWKVGSMSSTISSSTLSSANSSSSRLDIRI